jgi:hypothetical protein
MSASPQAVAPNPHTNLLNVYIQIENKMGVQKKKKMKTTPRLLRTGKETIWNMETS